MTTIEANSDTDDGIKLLWTNTEHGDTYEVSVFIGYDGVTVIQVDTPSDVGRIRVPSDVGRVRVNLNEGVIWDGDPENDTAPGEYGVKWLAAHEATK